MPPVLSLNEMAPDFIFQPLLESGTELKLSADKLSLYQGKVIYLDFWASWCKPCLKSMPLLNQMRNELKADGFEVIAVNLDNNPENGRTFLELKPVDYPVVHGDTDFIFQLYQINGLPTSYLIDQQGKLRFAHQGFKVEDIDTIRQQVILLLKHTEN